MFEVGVGIWKCREGGKFIDCIFFCFMFFSLCNCWVIFWMSFIFLFFFFRELIVCFIRYLLVFKVLRWFVNFLICFFIVDLEFLFLCKVEMCKVLCWVLFIFFYWVIKFKFLFVCGKVEVLFKNCVFCFFLFCVFFFLKLRLFGFFRWFEIGECIFRLVLLFVIYRLNFDGVLWRWFCIL